MAGYREFQTGEVLTSANVNSFLMNQAVMVFADAAARTAALSGAETEGMLTYNLDTSSLEIYDGTAFGSASPLIKQIVVATDTTRRTTTSITDTNAFITANITPTKAGNNVYCLWMALREADGGGAARRGITVRLLADGTPIAGAEASQVFMGGSSISWEMSTGAVIMGRYVTVGTSSVSVTSEFRVITSGTAEIRNDVNTGILLLVEVEV